MKVIKYLLILTILLINGNVYCQQANELKIYVGTSKAELKRDMISPGMAGYDVNGFKELGLKYSKRLFKNFYLETGFNYSFSTVKIYTVEPVFRVGWYHDLEILSIPINVNYKFFKYFFVSGGPILDYQKVGINFDSQTGVGYGFGIGVEYYLKNFVVYIFPNFKKHAVIPSDEQKHHQKLQEYGIQFGIGYYF